MLIKHKVSNFEVTPHKTMLGNLKGLMFKRIKNDGAILIFQREREISVHTFFVLYKLDIIYLDNEKKIIKIFKSVKPFSIMPKIKASYVIELKNKNNLEANEKLDF